MMIMPTRRWHSLSGVFYAEISYDELNEWQLFSGTMTETRDVEVARALVEKQKARIVSCEHAVVMAISESLGGALGKLARLESDLAAIARKWVANELVKLREERPLTEQTIEYVHGLLAGRKAQGQVDEWNRDNHLGAVIRYTPRGVKDPIKAKTHMRAFVYNAMAVICIEGEPEPWPLQDLELFLGWNLDVPASQEDHDAVDEWNRNYPIGTSVSYTPMAGQGQARTTTWREAALHDGRPSIYLTGVARPVLLAGITPYEPSDQMKAELKEAELAVEVVVAWNIKHAPGAAVLYRAEDGSSAVQTETVSPAFAVDVALINIECQDDAVPLDSLEIVIKEEVDG